MDINPLVSIEGKLLKDGSELKMKILADNTFMKLHKDDKQKAGKYLESLGGHFMLQPNFRIDEHCVTYSPKVPISPKKYNTIVTVHLPYTLHVPNELIYDIEQPFAACLYFRKQWTNAATGSSEADVVTEKRTYIAGQAKIAGPVLPLDPTLGWEPRSTGLNVEKAMDTDGRFRYTIATIEFNTAKDKTKSSLEIVKEISARALEVINRALKIYQHVADAIHVQPLPQVVVTDIYFAEDNNGLLPVLDTGIGNAIMNLAYKDVENFHALLESDFEPNVTDLLFANAQWAHHRKDYKLAVMESFIATDTCVENYLAGKYLPAGKSTSDLEKVMVGTTRTRFKNNFKDFHPDNFNVLYPTEYASWEKLYLDVRNPVMHQGKIPSEQESLSSLQENDSIIKLIRNLK